MNRSLCVVKIGGSLLAQPAMPGRLRDWLAASRRDLPETTFVLIAGGGGGVDWLRELDRLQPLGEARAHWLAIDLMAINLQAIAAWLPDLPLVSELELLQKVKDPALLFDARRFLRKIEPTTLGTKLPTDWSVTSDSIAARLAVALQAELCLLKSSSPPGESWQANAEIGFVDPFFPQLVSELGKIRCECL